MGRLARSWTLFKASWQVLRSDKELILFPILSGAACVLLLLSFALPIALAGDGGRFERIEEEGVAVLEWVLLFAFYFGTNFIVTFFNVALVACAVKRLDGGDPTIGYGIAEASSRLGLIVGWSLLSATVGLVLRAIEERSEWLGRLVAGLFGMLWALVSFFVVPILVVERKGPFAALKESGALLRKTWGEQLVAGFSFGLVSFLLMIPGVLILVGGIAAAVSGLPVLLWVNILAAGVVWLLGVGILSSTLKTIFQTALYLWARDGKARGPFAEATLRGALGPKKGK